MIADARAHARSYPPSNRVGRVNLGINPMLGRHGGLKASQKILRASSRLFFDIGKRRVFGILPAFRRWVGAPAGSSGPHFVGFPIAGR